MSSSSLIKKITRKDGTVVYRFVVHVGCDPATGKRKQLTRTFERRKDAQAELDRIRHERRTGDYVQPSKRTVDEALDALVPALTVDVERATAANYADAMRPVRQLFGTRALQSLDEADMDELVRWMLTSGRVRGGRPGTGLSVRAVTLTLGRFRAVLNEAVRRKWVTRNVAAYTKIPRQARRDEQAKREAQPPWTTDELQAFLRATRGHRLFAVFLLACLGMRPAEVCGLRWSDVNLDEGTLTICNTRTIVGGDVVEKTTKSKAGTRVLPLPAPVVAALRAFRKVQAAERLAAGEGYTSTGYVLVDELGLPQRTDWLRRRAYEQMMAERGIRRVRWYSTRHACLTFLAASGVPVPILAAWAGHADGGALAMRTYVKPNAEHLRGASDALAQLLG